MSGLRALMIERPSGRLKLMNTVVGGRGVRYLSLHQSGKWAFV